MADMAQIEEPRRALTERQTRFVEEYQVDANATQAAIRAGYSPDSAEAEGSRLLRNAGVSREVLKARLARADRLEIEADRVVEALASIAFSDPRELYEEREVDGQISCRLREPTEWPEHLARAVASVKVKRYPARKKGEEDMETVEVKFWPKNPALEALAKHLSIAGFTRADLAVTPTGNWPSVLVRNMNVRVGVPDPQDRMDFDDLLAQARDNAQARALVEEWIALLDQRGLLPPPATTDGGSDGEAAGAEAGGEAGAAGGGNGDDGGGGDGGHEGG